jgi:hypothetical protein
MTGAPLSENREGDHSGRKTVELTREVFTYWLSVVAMSSVLIWGLRLVSKILQTQDNGKPFLARALSEKGEPPKSGDDNDPSFSRVAGALGAVGLAATFVGIGYWVMYELYFGTDLTKLSNLNLYFLSGSALFLPYAFNRLASIFKP